MSHDPFFARLKTGGWVQVQWETMRSFGVRHRFPVAVPLTASREGMLCETCGQACDADGVSENYLGDMTAMCETCVSAAADRESERG